MEHGTPVGPSLQPYPSSLGEGEVGRAAPGPRGRRLLGSISEVRRDRIGFITHAQRDFGDVVHFRMGGRHLFLVSSPEPARHVLLTHQSNYRIGLGLEEARPLLGGGLLTADGEPWATMRRRLHGAFDREGLAAFGAAIVASTDARIRKWRDGETIELTRETPRLALDILGRTLLRADLASRADLIASAVHLFGQWSLARMASLVKLPLGWPGRRSRAASRAVRELEVVIAELVAERRRLGPSPGPPDTLDLLLAGEPPLSERQIRDEVATLLVAGHETTACGLLWTLAELAARPALAAEVADEVTRVLGDEAPTTADLSRLPLTGAVVDEVLRLYPPVWMLPRRAIAADMIGGHPVPAGAEVLISVFGIQRHPRHWPEPDELRPERFLVPGSDRPDNAYLPFGWGPRACLGRAFGRLEMVLATARLAQQVELSAPSPWPVGFEALLTLQPAQPVTVRVRHREKVRVEVAC